MTQTVYGRAVQWLCGHSEVLDDEKRPILIKALLTRRAPLIVGVLSAVLLAVATEIRFPGSVWPPIWMALECALLLLRVRLVKIALQQLNGPDDGAFRIYVGAALAWCALTGVGACACVLSSDPILVVLAGINVSGVAASLASRSAAFPRLALTQIFVVCVPMSVGAVFTSNHAFALLALQIPLSMIAMSSLAINHYSDMLNLIQAEHENRFLAYHDPLTGLPNRKSFDDELGRRCRELAAGAAPAEKAFALLCLDLDGFKPVNDTFGHPTGDRLLQVVAGRLNGVVRASDLVARRGGDEFVVLLPAADPPEAQAIAERIIAQTAEPFELDPGVTVTIGISIGIVFAPGHGSTAPMLVARADQALYAAKRAGRGRYSIYSSELCPVVQLSSP